MKIDIYTSAGAKKGSLELPSAVFEAPINPGLMHLALVRQQSNRRSPIAHVRHRGEIAGSTKKLFQQKGTGRARRGPIRSPLLRGGGKAFGPRNEANFSKEMPKKMRRAALFSCLSLRAKEGAILGLEDYPETVKTKTFVGLLKKLPVQLGRKITLILSRPHRGVELSSRNIPGIKTLPVSYLNPEDVLGSKNLIFMVDAVARVEEIFGAKCEEGKISLGKETKESKETKETKDEKPMIKKKTSTTTTKKSLDSSPAHRSLGKGGDSLESSKKKSITKKKPAK